MHKNFLIIFLINLTNAAIFELTPKNFDNLVNKGKDTWIIQFYSPDCVYCKRFEPEFELTAKRLEDTNIKVGKMDAVQFDDFSARYNVNSYPTIKFFRPGSYVPDDYSGPRQANSLVQAAIDAARGKTRRTYSEVEAEPVCPRVQKLVKRDYLFNLNSA